MPGVNLFYCFVYVVDSTIYELNLDKYCFPQFLEIYSCYLVTISEQGHDSQKVLNIANQKLKNEFRIFHSTIQVELYQESVMTNCVDCQDLQD